MKAKQQSRGWSRKAAVIICSLGAALLAGCGGGGATISFNPIETTPTIISTSDGRITAEIPADAFTGPVDLTLTNRSEEDAAVPGPEGRMLLMAVELLGVDTSEPVEPAPADPGGDEPPANETSQTETETTVLAPASAINITLRLSPALPGPRTLPVYTYNATSDRYEDASISGTVPDDGDECTFAISAFGRYAIYGLVQEEVAPSPPGSIELLAASTQIRKLGWQSISGGYVVGLNLYRGAAGAESFTKLNSEPLTTRIYSDELAAPGAYEYYLTATSTSGLESEPGPVLASPDVDFDLFYTFGQERLISPQDMALSTQQDLLLVTDPGAGRIWVFNLDGEYLDEITHYGNAPVTDPAGISFNPDEDRIYIADAQRNGVYILDTDFDLIGYFGGRATGPGNFIRPSGVGVIFDEAVIGDTVLVADEAQSTLQTFTGLGVYLDTVAEFGTEQGFFDMPQTMLVTPDRIYAADGGNGRVQVLTYAFEFESPIELLPEDDGPLIAPRGLELDFRGRLYVCDTGNQRVVVFDNSGSPLFHFGAEGDLRIEFARPEGPRGLAIDDTTGYLYITDPGSDRIVVFKS